LLRRDHGYLARDGTLKTVRDARSMTTDEPTGDDTQHAREQLAATDDAEHRVPRTTTTGDPEQDYRKKDDGANSEFRAHGGRGPYHHVDGDDHAWEPPEADDDA
jgi:hypothetical protein